MPGESVLFHEAVLAHAARDPDAVAVESADRSLSYAELAARAHRVALHLRRHGVGPDVPVAIALDRSTESVVAVLGTLLAGGAWVPLDPSYPTDRLSYMLADSGVDLIVAEAHTMDRLPAGRVRRIDPAGAAAESGPAPDPLPPAPTGRHLAYVIYTSGSTGRPKGALLSHAGLANLVRAQADAFGVRPGDRVLQFAPSSFDASVFETAMALATGATLVLADRATTAPGPDLFATLRTRRISHLTLPPSVLATLPDEPLPDLAVLVCAGEALPAALVRRWAPGRRMFNAYGPTEATVWATLAQVRPDDRRPSIGVPVTGVHVAVVDPDGRPVPDGQVGELVIGGAGVARGYHARPGLTAERFVPDPDGPPGARRYRSGDQVCRRPDGTLDFLGRIDHQIKLRGHRIEPDEVAAVLAGHPAVTDAVVVARGSGDATRLVGYAASDHDPAGLRAFLAERLPAYLVPDVVVTLDALPLTVSGKIDRSVLPEPDRASAGLTGPVTVPRTGTERLLAGFLADLLGHTSTGPDPAPGTDPPAALRLGVHDDIFALGANSLMAGRLAARVRTELGRELPVVVIYRSPTVAAMAAALDDADDTDRAPTPPPLTPADPDAVAPLSLPQERIWFLDQLDPGNRAYHAQATMRLRGPLDPAALRAALDEIVRRHDIFRTGFVAGPHGPEQHVTAHRAVDLPLVDLSAYDEPERGRRAEQIVAGHLREPFDLASPPLARWALVRHADDDHTLVHVEHHLIHDGWSFAVFVEELTALYAGYAAGQEPDLPPPSCRYRDFTLWQRGWMRGETLDRHLSHWTRELAGAPHELALPLDRARPLAQSFTGAALRIELPGELCARLRRYSRRHGVTLYATMLAGFAALLGRYARQDDMIIGSGVANRRLAETERMIGMVVNTLLLRVDLSGRPGFTELVRRVHTRAARAYEWADVPLDRLVEALDPVRDPSRNPLFQTMFSFHDSPMPELTFAGLTGTVLERHNGTAKTDLNIVVLPRAEQRAGQGHRDDAAPITLIWEYSTALFDASTMRRMTGHYVRLLDAAMTGPDQPVGRLPLLDAQEWTRVVHTYNRTAVAFPADHTVPDLFAEQVARRPHAPAVEYEGQTLSYADLDADADRLARLLRRRGVGADTPVGVLFARGPDLITAFLAVLKAGGAYVPLDPGYPGERLRWLLADSGARLVVTRADLAGLLPVDGVEVVTGDDPQAGPEGRRDAGPESPAARPDSAAYVLYTSGSTGRPKGVVVPHRAILRLVCGTDFVRFGPHERIAQVADASFDAITFEVWGALLHGGTVCVIPRDTVLSPGRLGDELRRSRITSMFLTSALFNEVMAHRPDSFATMTNLLVGGDALNPVRIRQLLRGPYAPARLLNGYGPTETTTFAVVHHITDLPDEASSVPIGRPIANTTAYVLDEELSPVPEGVPGQLYLGGPGVARGYAGRPALTAQRFVPDPFGADGSSLYHTGDVVRWRSGGVLEFLGRTDDQVKISGFRIEPGEVENTLLDHPAVAGAAVVVDDSPAGRRLVAYVVPPASRPGPGATELRLWLAERLPPYLVPTAYVSLTALPLTEHGKLDRAALPAAEAERPDLRVALRTPQTDTERAVAAICAELIGLDQVGLDDDFFALGGHSLLAMRLVARVNETFGTDVALARFLRTPTVAGLVAALDTRTPATEPTRQGGIAPGSWQQMEDVLRHIDQLTPEQVDQLLHDFTDNEVDR
ncbi:amino acid adenylation domain-containing protein [Micromonospora sp. NPDC020750]|uniref:amino acid adenylation domain-containing protein n=1 Tax=unclassified Micromonospora TaxID=2617518 RepID=UPI0037BA54F9